MCVFCDIAQGREDAEVVFEDDVSIAFLDHRPIFPGHCLLITRAHHETLPDLPDELIEPFFRASRLLAGVVPAVMEADGSFVAINNKVSQSVPHLHIHVVPRRKKDGLRGFFWPRRKYRDDEELKSVADKLRAAIARAG